ncbi:MAG: PEP-CTERM sorting domain-containing protein [Planctomycetota bacterium]|nr:MAG: PEP-CTERM sorting domain-containing protein [Planctomycetota bacterium]
MWQRRALRAAAVGGTAFLGAVVASAWDLNSDPWADSVVDYAPGVGANPAFLDPTTALGEPERFTGEGVFPSAVTIFNPAFGTDELVSIGEGGSLTLAFDEPITDDPAHRFGVDLIVFGNGGFIDVDFPNGRIGSPAALFGVDLMNVSVSPDNVNWAPLGSFSEGLFPTQGYQDTPPQSPTPGSVPTSFQRPIDPSLTASDFDGLTYADALALYDGSGGGTPIDIAASGFASIQFIRFENVTPGTTVEIEAVAAVPEPSGLVLGGAAFVGFALRRKR